MSFLQHDSGEYLAGLEALEALYPDFIKVRSFSDILGRDVTSAGGREIYMIEITDFTVDEAGKVPVAVSLSVHGPERAGIEGGVRYAEDLARWGAEDPEHEMCNGTEEDSECFAASTVLDRVHIYLTNMNPDGWSDGDIANGGVFMRGNANGTDLNRQFPTKGWTKLSYQPETEPETNAWIELMDRIEPEVAGDLHGELTSANNAFADIMYPAGQWDPLEQAQEERLARHMASNVTRYFEMEGVVAGDATGVAGMRPAEYRDRVRRCRLRRLRIHGRLLHRARRRDGDGCRALRVAHGPQLDVGCTARAGSHRIGPRRARDPDRRVDGRRRRAGAVEARTDGLPVRSRGRDG